MKNVILSTALVLEDGTYNVRTITLEEAKKWVNENNPENYCGHATTLAVGIEPSKERKTCARYDNALVLKPAGRLEFGKEYTLDEILEIGVTPMLIELDTRLMKLA